MDKTFSNEDIEKMNNALFKLNKYTKILNDTKSESDKKRCLKKIQKYEKVLVDLGVLLKNDKDGKDKKSKEDKNTKQSGGSIGFSSHINDAIEDELNRADQLLRDLLN